MICYIFIPCAVRGLQSQGEKMVARKWFPSQVVTAFLENFRARSKKCESVESSDASLSCIHILHFQEKLPVWMPALSPTARCKTDFLIPNDEWKNILIQFSKPNSSRLWGISPQSCTETDFEMKTSNFVLFLLISVVSVHFRAIYDETIRCQA